MLVVEDVTSVVWSPVWASTVFFILLVIILLVRPQGLFGQVKKKAMRIFKTVGLLALLVIALAFPLLFPNSAVTTIAVFTLLFAALPPAGISSQAIPAISLWDMVSTGVGAYALAIMCLHWNIPGGYIPFLLVPVAGLVAAAFSVVLGWIALRVRRHTFVVITIAMFLSFNYWPII